MDGKFLVGREGCFSNLCYGASEVAENMVWIALIPNARSFYLKNALSSSEEKEREAVLACKHFGPTSFCPKQVLPQCFQFRPTIPITSPWNAWEVSYNPNFQFCVRRDEEHAFCQAGAVFELFIF